MARKGGRMFFPAPMKGGAQRRGDFHAEEVACSARGCGPPLLSGGEVPARAGGVVWFPESSSHEGALRAAPGWCGSRQPP